MKKYENVLCFKITIKAVKKFITNKILKTNINFPSKYLIVYFIYKREEKI